MTERTGGIDRAAAAADRGPQSRALRVLFVTPQGAEAPGPRYRVYQFLPSYRRAGLDVTTLAMQGAASTRRSLYGAHASALARFAHLVTLGLEAQLLALRLCREAPRYDRVFLYRIPLPRWSRRFLEPHRARILYDFDDALDLVEAEGGFGQGLRARVLRSGLETAVAVSAVTVTSNARNAAVVQALGGRATMVPTVVDLDRLVFRDRSSAGHRPLILGWIGTPSTSRYLPLIEDALTEVRRTRDVVVRLVGAGRSPFSRLEAECRPWSAESEAAEIAAFDIGLMPMPDTAWTRGKAALKALQYGASGAPTVASWTPTNAEILGEDQGALLCRDEGEWVANLTRLVDDGALRGRLGQHARRRVESDYSLQVVAPRLCRLILAPDGCSTASGPEAP